MEPTALCSVTLDLLLNCGECCVKVSNFKLMNVLDATQRASGDPDPDLDLLYAVKKLFTQN
jgi:hypothetical protein